MKSFLLPPRTQARAHTCSASFTLIELMAASTVLSIILLLMVGMQDQMSRAWSNANRRSETTREARAAASLLSGNLATLILRPAVSGSQFSALAEVVSNAPVPFYYFNGTGSPSLTIPNYLEGSQMIFGLLPQKSQTNAAGNPADFALVGYYLGSGSSTNVNGFVTTNYHLYRYYIPPSNAWSPTITWLGTPGGGVETLFTNIGENSDILARNACNLRIGFLYDSGNPANNQITNGPNYSIPASTGNFYTGNKLAVELSFYPDEIAQKLPLDQWTNSTNVRRYARSFEFRIDLPKP